MRRCSSMAVVLTTVAFTTTAAAQAPTPAPPLPQPGGTAPPGVKSTPQAGTKATPSAGTKATPQAPTKTTPASVVKPTPQAGRVLSSSQAPSAPGRVRKPLFHWHRRSQSQSVVAAPQGGPFRVERRGLLGRRLVLVRTGSGVKASPQAGGKSTPSGGATSGSQAPVPPQPGTVPSGAASPTPATPAPPQPGIGLGGGEVRPSPSAVPVEDTGLPAEAAAPRS